MTKTTSNTPPAPAKANKSELLQIERNPDKSEDRLVAEMAAAGIAGNAVSVVRFGKGTFGELSLGDCIQALKGTISDVKGGDLSSAEAMLAAQAAALNAMFCELARRAATNMVEHLGATESYMRLALKAQGQCRATLETLAAIKNPPVVFARQANISHGPQQVNNGPAPHAANAAQACASASAHPGETVFRPNELIEEHTHGRPQMDTRATAAAGRTNQGLEPVGALDRPAKHGGQG